MVVKAGGYFGRPFKGYRGVTKGDPLSPIIFNVVMDAVIHHWVTVVMLEEAGVGGPGMTILDLAAYFYADYGLVESTQLERLQRSFDVLIRILDRVGLQTNTAKTVGMVCQPCHAPVRISEEAYERRTMNKGPIFQERQRRSMEFLEYVVEVAAVLLLTQRQD